MDGKGEPHRRAGSFNINSSLPRGGETLVVEARPLPRLSAALQDHSSLRQAMGRGAWRRDTDGVAERLKAAGEAEPLLRAALTSGGDGRRVWAVMPDPPRSTVASRMAGRRS